MLIKFWGVRGSISAPGAQTIRYGGNTPCVQITGDGGATVVIDAGYGIVGLGEEIMARQPKGPVTIQLVLTHLHWDHIQGLPFFAPVYIPGNRLLICSASAETARVAMERLFTSLYSPIMGVENLGAHLEYQEIGEGVNIDEISLMPVPLNHNTPTLGYRITDGKVTICHAADHEGGQPGEDQSLITAARGVDLLIHDAQFTPEEYQRYRGWGHSETGVAVSNALAASVQRLALFHYNPTHTDDVVEEQLAYARELAGACGPQIIAAAEGMMLTL